jgi:GAF domain-containing protein
MQSSPNSGDRPPDRDRRRIIRQKLHSPVYASFNRPQTGTVVDLSELLDLHEEGFAVQTAENLEINRAVTLCLELPETHSYIHGLGQVVWSDDKGRGGIRFSDLNENSKRILKEWLLTNLLIGGSNHAARSEQIARHRQEEVTAGAPSSVVESTTLPAIEIELCPPATDEPNVGRSLDALRLEIQGLGQDADAIFHAVTVSALRLTVASGVALALLDHGAMIMRWRGRAGEPAPPLGAPVDVSKSLSGECVRSARLVFCEDMGNDPRVDPEVGRALGIGSLMAAPILFDSRVVGLLEAFYPQPRNFTQAEINLLQQIVEVIPRSCLEQSQQTDRALRAEVASSSFLQAELSDNRTTNSELEPDESNPVDVAAMQPADNPVMIENHDPPPVATHGLRQVDSKQTSVSQVDPATAEPEPPTPSRLLYRALIGLVIVVVAMVVGYLLGPAMEKRWTSSTLAAQQSNARPVETRSPGSGRQIKTLSELQRLSRQGDADAQWQLGLRYHDGEEVAQDDAQAMQWFLRAAEQGHAIAQATAGAYYWAGRGVPQDLSKAYFWSAIALAQGDENSKSRLEGLASQMTRSQVSAARQQAEVWVRSHSERAKSDLN